MTPINMQQIYDSLALELEPLSPIPTAPSMPAGKSLPTMVPSIPTTCSLFENGLGVPKTSQVNISSIAPVLPAGSSVKCKLTVTGANALLPQSPAHSLAPFVVGTSRLPLSRQRSTCSTSSTILSGPTSPRTALYRMSRLPRRSPPQSPKSKRSKLGHQSAKNSFLELLEELQIVNVQQYEESLVKSYTLRKLEKAIQPSTLEQIKKIQFRQNFLLLRHDISLKSRIVLPTSEHLLASLRGGWRKFFRYNRKR